MINNLKEFYKSKNIKRFEGHSQQNKKQTQFLKENFSIDKMTKVLKSYMDQIQPVVNNPIKLPKLKSINSTPDLPKLKLPKLNKING